MDNIRRVSFVRFKQMKNDVDTLFFFDPVWRRFIFLCSLNKLTIAVEYNSAEQVAHADFFKNQNLAWISDVTLGEILKKRVDGQPVVKCQVRRWIRGEL
jgi:hypothetical protein